MKFFLSFLVVSVLSAIGAILLLTVAPVVLSILAAVLVPVLAVALIVSPIDFNKAKNGEF